MENIKAKRMIAVIIDLLIVSLLCLLINEIKFLNPHYEKYQKSINEYETYYSENLSDINNVSINSIKNDEYAKLYYDISYYGVSYLIIKALVIIAYYTLFSYFNDGMTIGKRIMKIKVVSQNGKKASFIQLFIRSLLIPMVSIIIMNNAFGNILLAITVFVFNYQTYFEISNIISNLINVLCYIDAIMLVSKTRNNTLHDFIAKTKVIEMNEANN